jgi:hypothetical protein
MGEHQEIRLGESSAQSGASLQLAITKDVLDEIALTRIGIILAIGLTVGFGVGSAVPVAWCWALVIGIASGVAACFVMVLLFRTDATRKWLRRLDDLAKPQSRRVG